MYGDRLYTQPFSYVVSSWSLKSRKTYVGGKSNSAVVDTMQMKFCSLCIYAGNIINYRSKLNLYDIIKFYQINGFKLR